MIVGEADSFLAGNPYDGFEGVLTMPFSATNCGEPAIDAVGHGLLMLAGFLYPKRDCRCRFRALVHRVLETYATGPTLDLPLLYQAHKNQWPEWAVECLPNLNIFDRSFPDGSEQRYIWHYVVGCLRATDYSYEVVAKLCQEKVLKTKMSPEAS